MLKPPNTAVAAAALLPALPLVFTARQAAAGQRWIAGRRGAWTGTATSEDRQ